jgi:hypothetical protein
MNLYYRGRNHPKGHRIKVCCDAVESITANSLKEAMDGRFTEPYWENLKQNFRDDEWPTACRKCETDELRQKESHRQVAIRTFELENEEQVFETLGNKPPVLQLDVRPNNKCNLMCRMCTPVDSSLIAEHAGESQTLVELYGERDIADGMEPPTFTVPPKEYLTGITNIRMLGGEPTLDENCLELLDRMIELGKGDEVHISITTNGTNARKSFLERIKHFNTNLRFSIDGYGPFYEYVRTYGNWNKLERNIDRLAPHAARMGANFVLQMYNVFGAGQYALWLDTMYEKYPNWNQRTFAIPLEWPQGFDIGNLTSDHRKQLAEELNNIEQKVHHPNTIKFIQQCVNWINTRQKPSVLVPQQSFKQLTLAMDKQRSTSLLELDERFREYIK